MLQASKRGRSDGRRRRRSADARIRRRYEPWFLDQIVEGGVAREIVRYLAGWIVVIGRRAAGLGSGIFAEDGKFRVLVRLPPEGWRNIDAVVGNADLLRIGVAIEACQAIVEGVLIVDGAGEVEPALIALVGTILQLNFVKRLFRRPLGDEVVETAGTRCPIQCRRWARRIETPSRP